jgi:hypothetical protein
MGLLLYRLKNRFVFVKEYNTHGNWRSNCGDEYFVEDGKNPC